jgi:hypothetical protein
VPSTNRGTCSWGLSYWDTLPPGGMYVEGPKSSSSMETNRYFIFFTKSFSYEELFFLYIRNRTTLKCSVV